MIRKYFPNAHILKDFNPIGLSSLIQNTTKGDILFINVTADSKIATLVRDHLCDEFDGLIVATSAFEGIDKYNHIVLDKNEFKQKQTELMDEFYPEKKVNVVGVTGTNGKTTVCWLLSELAKQKGKKVLYLGTVGVFYNGKKIDTEIGTTTPSLLDLRKITNMVTSEIDLVVLEVSSHALEQGRLAKIKLSACAWTNISQDHLDYHKTMDSYFDAKMKIIESLKKESNVFLSKDQEDLYQKINYDFKIKAKPFDQLDILGANSFFNVSYNKENLELACSLFESQWGDVAEVNISEITPPPGRFENIAKDDVLFVVDYAHTPEAVKKILQSIKDGFSNCFLITVLGCGGDRDREKRPLMANAALALSDFSFFTSDNPRGEGPESIIDDMIKNVGAGNFSVVVDRKLAITNAFEKAVSIDKKRRSIIAVLGKGHETYQEIKGNKFYFSDRDVILKL